MRLAKAPKTAATTLVRSPAAIITFAHTVPNAKKSIFSRLREASRQFTIPDRTTSFATNVTKPVYTNRTSSFTVNNASLTSA